MPWKERSIMSQRLEFVELASQPGSNRRELCRRFGISPTTAYKWLRRYAREGVSALTDRSRRPHHSSRQTAAEKEALVVAVRDEHPRWGGRKIRRRLNDLGHAGIPAASTITTIVRRTGRALGAPGVVPIPWQRFEAAAPNALWQMDFKGHFALRHGRCHPLTIVDDHSRFAVGLRACGKERGATVQAELTTLFERYGLPEAMVMDNGAPWRGPGATLSTLEVWLLRLGIHVRHGRPYHPQTQGKDERFHRTLQAEVLSNRAFVDLAHVQRHFDPWRDVYNLERPHDSLGLATPASRYQPSWRRWPTHLPQVEYGPTDAVRKVQARGEIYFAGRTFFIANALHRLPVAVRPASTEGTYEVFFCHHRIRTISLQSAAQ